MEIIVSRNKEKDTTYVLIRNIIIAVMAVIMAMVSFFMAESHIATTIVGIVCLLIAALLIATGIRDFKFNKRINSLPDEAICKHYKKLVICNKEDIYVSFLDIKKIKCRRYIKTSFGLAQYISRDGVIKIVTDRETIVVEAVEDVVAATKMLKKLVKLK